MFNIKIILRFFCIAREAPLTALSWFEKNLFARE